MFLFNRKIKRRIINNMVYEKHIGLAIVASALGFFVDLYDIIIFSIVRTKSLLAIGIAEKDLLAKGVILYNVQMVGMLIGGFIWESSEINSEDCRSCLAPSFFIQQLRLQMHMHHLLNGILSFAFWLGLDLQVSLVQPLHW